MLRVLLAASLFAGPGGVGVPVGMLIGRGKFRLNDRALSANASVFENDRIETQEAPVRVHLASGVRISMAPRSRGSIQIGGFTLEKGDIQFTASAKARFVVSAESIRIVPTASAARVMVRLDRNSVAAGVESGSARVQTAAGVTIANIVAGQALQFSPHTEGVRAVSQVVGCLERSREHYLLRDQTTKLLFRVQGTGLDSMVGRPAEFSGRESPAAPGGAVDRILQVQRIRSMAGSCPSR